MPEASVIRGVQALSGFIGRKELRRRIAASCFKDPGLTRDFGRRWVVWRKREGVGTDREAVKCVDMIRNTEGVGRHLTFS